MRRILAAILLLSSFLLHASSFAAGSWQTGALRPDTSWWVRVQPDGVEPAVSVTGSGKARVVCLGPVEEPQSCTLIARGPWLRLVVEGEVVGERLLLPVVATGGP